MPYIPPAARALVDAHIDALVQSTPRPLMVGVMNYIITRLLMAMPHATYAELNALVGVLECAKLELYRRVAAPYEDAKRREHGDVY